MSIGPLRADRLIERVVLGGSDDESEPIECPDMRTELVTLHDGSVRMCTVIIEELHGYALCYCHESAVTHRLLAARWPTGHPWTLTEVPEVYPQLLRRAHEHCARTAPIWLYLEGIGSAEGGG